MPRGRGAEVEQLFGLCPGGLSGDCKTTCPKQPPLQRIDRKIILKTAK